MTGEETIEDLVERTMGPLALAAGTMAQVAVTAESTIQVPHGIHQEIPHLKIELLAEPHVQVAEVGVVVQEVEDPENNIKT